MLLCFVFLIYFLALLIFHYLINLNEMHLLCLYLYMIFYLIFLQHKLPKYMDYIHLVLCNLLSLLLVNVVLVNFHLFRHNVILFHLLLHMLNLNFLNLHLHLLKALYHLQNEHHFFHAKNFDLCLLMIFRLIPFLLCDQMDYVLCHEKLLLLLLALCLNLDN